MQERDRELTALIEPVAAKYDCNNIEACFKTFKEFCLSWRFNGNKTTLYISDYLIDAPDHVIENCVDTLFKVIKKKDHEYDDNYMAWVTSDSFINSKRKIYLKRSKNLTRSDIGKTRLISDSVQRLLEQDLLVPSDIDNSIFTWTSRPSYRKVGYCSPMMRVVAISSALDREEIPNYVLDYVVYHESLHLRQGYRPFRRSHDTQFRKMERLFPQYKEAEAYLKDLKDRS